MTGPRAPCPECRSRYTLRTDGTVRWHRWRPVGNPRVYGPLPRIAHETTTRDRGRPRAATQRKVAKLPEIVPERSYGTVHAAVRDDAERVLDVFRRPTTPAEARQPE